MDKIETDSQRQVDWSEFLHLTDEQADLLIREKLERARLYSEAYRKREALLEESR